MGKRAAILPLTSARFFAALFVVLFHWDIPQGLIPFGLSGFGYQAVAFFFILSGFVLTYAHGEPNGRLNISNSRFALARISRIFPTYYLGLLIALPFFALSWWRGHSSLLDAALVLTMLQTWHHSAALAWNSPAWSLSNEVFFYALFPWIWALSSALGPRHLLVLSYIGIIAASGSGLFGGYFPIANLPQFTLGVALGGLYLEKRRLGSLWLYVTSAALLFLIVAKQHHEWLGDPIVTAPVFGTLIFALACNRCTWLSWAPLTILGEASYAIYILHFPIWLWWNHETALPPWLDLVGYISLVVVCSVSVFFLIERPIRGKLRVSMRQGFIDNILPTYKDCAGCNPAALVALDQSNPE